MSAHLYTLLCDLKVLTTGLLNYLVLHKRLNRQGVLSLTLLFAGISLGQIATMEVTAPPSGPAAGSAAGPVPGPGPVSIWASIAASRHQWLPGLVVMVLIALLSAAASVYTEWIMNFSTSFRHEPLSLQNMRLYAVGVLLNCVYYVQSGGLRESFMEDMRPSHWVIAAILACMGLVTVGGCTATVGATVGAKLDVLVA